jgi:hypothetical protein
MWNLIVIFDFLIPKVIARYLIALAILASFSALNLVILLILNEFSKIYSLKKSTVLLKRTCRCSLPKSRPYLGARLGLAYILT